MAISLRAFLMLCSPDGKWDIEVHHSLEEVVRSWEQRSDQKTCAVLHVGFERRVARSFDDIAREYRGRVLLTPGAKGALPRTFMSSEHPIAVVLDEPLFLGLEGWGYSETQPAQDVVAVAPAAFIGWVGSFVQMHPERAPELSSHSIVDDQSYLDHEADLTSEFRKALGMYRCKSLLGNETDNPCSFARAAPPWLADRALENLDLTVRISNVFRNRGVAKVADLGALTVSDLLTLPNFGRRSILHLMDILERTLAAGPWELADELESPSATTLLDAVRGSLLSCTERECDILTRRMGLDRPSETLEEIGASYAITRERIRQIEDKVATRLIKQEVWDDVLAAKLKVLLTDREYPLPLMGAEALDPWFAGIATQRSAMKYLIGRMCTAGARLVEIDGIEYLGFLSREDWEATLTSARHLLAGGVDAKWSKADCKRYVGTLLPSRAGEFASLLWDAASKWCHFSDDSEEAVLAAYGRGVEQLVEAVLHESETPLHYNEIALRASKRARREVDERRAHNAAAEVGYLFGPGTYGLLKHVAVSRAHREAIAGEAAEIVTEGPPNRQWHTSELMEALGEHGVSLPTDFDKYQLDIALKRQGQLRPLGRMVWAPLEGGLEGPRVEIRQAVISILQQAGGPLTFDDLSQRLIAVRGVNQGMQFAVMDPLIKLDSRTWGLNDRDIVLKRANQPAFLDNVVDTLRSRQSHIHISECSAVLGKDVPPRALFCLAASDARLQVIPGRFLALRD